MTIIEKIKLLSVLLILKVSKTLIRLKKKVMMQARKYPV